MHGPDGTLVSQQGTDHPDVEPCELKAGTVIGIYQPVEEDQIEASDVQAKSVLPGACQDHVTKCPPHVRPLLEQARQICETDDQFAKLAGLLTAYQDVFSRGDNDVRRTWVSTPFHC